MYNADGDEVPYGIINLARGDCRIAIEADLTPMNVTEFKVVPQGMPMRYRERLKQTLTSAEGERLGVSVAADGSLTLTDRKTGEVYTGLMTLLDDGEIGDGWFHCNPVNDTVITCTAASVEKIENNCRRVTFKVTQSMRLPERMLFGGNIHRGGEYRDFQVTNYITLTGSDRFLDIRTVISNNVKDHRLKMRFPSGVTEGEYQSSQAFGYVSRACGEIPGTENWKEYGYCERNTAGVVLKRNGNRGLAFISAYGIHECAVWENGDIDMTLFRTFRKTIGTNGEPDGELQEELEFRYRVMPLSKDETLADLSREQDFLQSGFLLNTASGHDAQKYRPMVAFDNPNFTYSTANGLPDAGASEIRLWNCADSTETGTVLLPKWAVKAEMTEIDGREICALPVIDGKVTLALTKWKIATVRFS